MRLFVLLSSFLILLSVSACFGTQKPAPVYRYKIGQGAGTTGAHTVMAGETLWLISKRYNIETRDIAVANNLAPPFTLAAGQRLRLPPPMRYKVRAGDGLNVVSRLFGVSSSEIARMNNLQPPYALKAGTMLRLPSITEKTRPAVFAPAEKMPVITQEPVVAEVLSSPAAPPLPPAEREKKPAAAKPEPVSPAAANVPRRAGSKFLRPVAGKIISSYGPKVDGLYNDGINIAAPLHAPVKAAENGVVVYAGDELKGFGNLVLIRHADRWVTAYGHMGRVLVGRGDIVKRGQTIGTVGSTGSVDSPQLHFETRRGTDALNPAMYMES